MDTLIMLRSESCAKLLEKAVYISLITGIVCIQSFLMTNPIMADELKLAHNTVPKVNIQGLKEKIMVEISPEARKKSFDENIKAKYPKAVITDIQDGVKHIKLTKYYNGRPVRINIVETD